MKNLETLLKRLTALHEAATPAKWEVDAGGYVVTVDPVPPQNLTHEISLQPPPSKRISPYERTDAATPDMELIAASRNSLPILIECLRVATEALDILGADGRRDIISSEAREERTRCGMVARNALARLDELARGGLK